MKSIVLLGTLLLTLGLSNPSPEVPANTAVEALGLELQEDFVRSVFNSELEERFETQFPDFVADVALINVHENEHSGYYYAVYGKDIKGAPVVEYFKTTAEEVAAEKYNYIEMNEHTMQNLFGRTVCREKTTPPWNPFCAPQNNGPICGVLVNGWCILF